jgi:hypothetical protein
MDILQNVNTSDASSVEYPISLLRSLGIFDVAVEIVNST